MTSVSTFFRRKQSARRHAAHALFWAFLALAAAFQLGLVRLTHEHEWFLAYMSILSALGLLGPWLLFRYVPGMAGTGNDSLLGALETMAGAGMVASWIGSFGLYRQGIGYDTAVHVFSSALLAVMVFMAVLAVRPTLDGRTAAILAIVAVSVAAGGTINEVFEWGGDRLFGTAMYGEAGEPNDTFKDALGNTAGFVLGSAYAYVNRKKLLGSITRT